MRKKKILIFIRHYRPGFRSGGPLVSISNLVERLGDEFDFSIVTSNHDAEDITPYPNIPIGKWKNSGNSNILFTPIESINPKLVCKILSETTYDLIYFQSLWDPRFTTLPLIVRRFGYSNTPVLIAPRGELFPGALALRTTKKLAFLKIGKLFSLYRSVSWHATAELEVEGIKKYFGRNANIYTAANLPTVNHNLNKDINPNKNKTTHIVFLSRVTPKKNLDGALRIIKRIKSPCRFTIYGPKRDIDFWTDCKNIIREMPSNIDVVDGGALTPERVIPELKKHDLFFLPTNGENYGHAIVDAFMAGLPVLISDKTPWRNLEEEGVGADYSLKSPELFVKWIEDFISMSDSQREKTRSRCLMKAINIGLANEAVLENRIMLEKSSRNK